jgi:hypothetical protein
MEGAERDSTQDWLLPAAKTPPRLGELELRVDEALAIARSSEAAVNVIGDAALEAAQQARRAAELAESASAVALDASRAVAARQVHQPEEEAVPAWRPAAVAPEAPVAAAPEEEAPSEPEPVPVPNGGESVPPDGEDEALRRFVERADRIAARLQAV